MNKKNFLLFFLILFGLILPQLSWAILGTGLFDYFQTVYQGISPIVQPLFLEILRFFFFYVTGIIALFSTASLLEFIILRPEWLAIQGHQMVESGFYFVSGLVNMLIILALVVIALAIILRLETFPAKKALVRLIIVALLMNFLLVLVGLLVDISNALYTTILEQLTIDRFGQKTSLVSLIFGQTLGRVWINLLTFAGWLGGMIVAFAVPFTGPFLQILTVTLLTTVLLPNILVWLFQIVILFLMTGILAVYIFLFLARIIVVQILAILSPLALLAWVFPQTEKYWSEWFKHLLQWIFLGIFLLFFLVLGLRATEYFLPTAEISPAPFVAWLKVPDYFFYYLFLFIYLLIVAWLATRASPVLAATLIAGGTLWAKGIWQGIGKPISQQIKTGWERAAGAYERREKERLEAAKKGRPLPPIKGGQGRILAERAITFPIRWAYRLAGTTPEVRMAQAIKKQAEAIEKEFGKDFYSAIKVYGRKLVDPQTQVALGLYLAKAGGGKGLKQLASEQLERILSLTSSEAPKRLVDIMKHLPEALDPEALEKMGIKKERTQQIASLLERTLVPEGRDDGDVKKLIDLGIREAEAIKKAAFKKAVDALKLEDIDTLTPATLENPEFQEMIIRFKPISFIRKIGEEKGQEYIDKIHKKFEELGPREVAKTNAILLRQIVTNPAIQAIFPQPRGIRELPTNREKLATIEILTREAREEVEMNRRRREEIERRPPTAQQDVGEEGAKKRKEPDVGQP